MNEYFSLGLRKRDVSFGRVWNKKSKLNDIAETNFMLKALHWIKKDLHGNAVSDYKNHIDPTLNRTYEIRNIMEHRDLKVLSYADKDIDKSDSDKLAYVISKKEFEDLVVNLLRVSRESIILLIMAINIEEIDKRRNIKDKNPLRINMTKYEDEWKF